MPLTNKHILAINIPLLINKVMLKGAKNILLMLLTIFNGNVINVSLLIILKEDNVLVMVYQDVLMLKKFKIILIN